MPTINHDFSTPEGAILSLEDAYRAKDVEAAVACKDFRTEAQLMLEKFKNMQRGQVDDNLIGKAAEVLELTYRGEFRKNGFPDMTGVTSAFSHQKSGSPNILIIIEICHYPDGGTSQQNILVANTEKGWRVLNPVH